MTKNVLVTGGAGFIGSHAAEYYSKKGDNVTIIDNLSRVDTLDADESRNTATYNWDYLQRNFPEIEFIEMDIRNPNEVEDIVEGHDAIIHTAGQVAVTASITNPRTDFEVNAKGTFNILEGARKAQSNPPVVFASTNKVYGDNINDIPVCEEDSRYRYNHPEFTDGVSEEVSIDNCEHTPYGVSKLTGDLYAQDYAERNIVDTAVFRMSCVYGTRQFGNEDQGWLAHFIISTLQDESLTIFGDGKQVRDLLYINDLIRAYDSFIENPSGRSGVYNIGGGPQNTASLLEFLDLVEEKTGKRTGISYEDWREGDQKVYISDISKVKENLDWEPQIGCEEGVSRFINWWNSSEKLK
jgi:CDP-paratose 2-epimerase